MLKTNIFAKANDDAIKAIAIATKYAEYNMTIELIIDKETALMAKIQNPKKTATTEMIDGWKSELEELQKEEAEIIKKAEAIEATATPIIEVIGDKLLRIIACADNSKLEKYAITWEDDESAKLYDALCNIHELDTDKIDAGNFKKSTDIIEKIVRINLTFPETEYTDKITIRLNGSDIKMINEAWVRGFRNKYSRDRENEITTYKDTKATYLVTRKKTKDGTYKYDWTRFNAILVKIAIAKIAAK